MPTDYKIWQTVALPESARDALLAYYRAWRVGKPTDRERVLFGMVKAGARPRDAEDVVRDLEQTETHELLLEHSGNGKMRPTLAAALTLAQDEDVRRDLDALAAIVRYLNTIYDPDRADIAITDLGAAIDVDPQDLQGILELGRLGGGPTIRIPSEALFWTTFDDFLAHRLRGRAAIVTDETPIAISAGIKQVRWMSLGPYRAATTLDLRTPMTVLVGANGVGKTTALAALSMLSEIAHHGLMPVRTNARLPPEADELVLAAVAELRRARAATTETVEWQLIAGRRGRLHACSETLRRVRPPVGELASFDRGTGRWLDADGRLVEHTMPPDALALTSATSHTAHSQLIALRQSLKRWRVELATARPGGDDPTLAWLWKQYREAPAANGALRDHVRAVTGTQIELSTHGPVIIDQNGLKVPPAFAATGVVRVIEILARLFAPEPPTLFAIDEIENHLHGDLVARLIDVMRSVSDRTQIVLTTHSARVVRQFDAAEVRLVRRNERTSSIISIADDPQLGRLIELGDIGDLLQDGYFAGGL